ncbi:MAG: hypothetical protein H6737_12860 [Alphaproteobacteria bacterium]|nr:hypothetical protein [Alphaproteobacteria bacterium]
MSEQDGLPVLPHLAGEFYTWLWWSSEVQGAVFSLPDPVGQIELWVDERLAFRNADDTKVTAVMTGEAPSTSLEARAALAGGKVLNDLRVGIRRDDREFTVTLKGPAMHITGAKLPQVMSEGIDEVLYDRMFLYGELSLVLAALYDTFAEKRVSAAWESEVLPGLRRWIGGEL